MDDMHDGIALGTATAAFIAFLAGLVQYRRTQQWKRSEFVAKEIKEFKDDPAIRNALLMLDCKGRYIELFPQEPGPEKRQALVTDELLSHALTPLPDKSAARLHEEFKTRRSPSAPLSTSSSSPRAFRVFHSGGAGQPTRV
jgi:hypothetical protein